LQGQSEEAFWMPEGRWQKTERQKCRAVPSLPAFHNRQNVVISGL
jgi:hypothetical protein